MTITIVKGDQEDAYNIAQVHIQAWQETYAHLIPRETLARLDVETRAARWAEIIGRGTTGVWVAKTGTGTGVGWAAASRKIDREAPRPLELEGLYVLAAHHGTGVGQQLLDAALKDEPAFLWMASDNPRADAFYRRNGFLPDGASKMHDLLGTQVPIVRLTREPFSH
ncbi:L-amino acid N-acyltransferase YncA [Arthrobacter subterraneus]|uniref:L-amino acid N-acyltransferase YncA n=1 Tax=Arthrobacter subterraneus TaxID=335973 RepID=A0A1G8K7C3_9MICC|nr:GNAT family N-acetyltransferase [Arthrobacter subterraneus]SDI39259.1 L-amino acid N-acyltransferase YncA [Arthrobacter subterraneus]